ncbi:MAG: hypothetical protein QW505_04135 [Thermoplasmata archaeon]
MILPAHATLNTNIGTPFSRMLGFNGCSLVAKSMEMSLKAAPGKHGDFHRVGGLFQYHCEIGFAESTAISCPDS